MALYNTYSDSELVALLQSNDQQAFTELYVRYWDKLFYLAGKKLDNLSEAEHMVQDVFMDLWKRRLTLDITIGDSILPYLVVSVKYRIINQLAKRTRQSKSENQAAQLLPSSDQSVSQLMDFKELYQRYQAELSRLPEKCALAFALRDEGLTYREIADSMDISPKTVEMHIGRALKTLRTRVGAFLFSFF